MKCLPPAQALALVNVQGTAASGQEFLTLEKENFKDAAFIPNDEELTAQFTHSYS